MKKTEDVRGQHERHRHFRVVRGEERNGCTQGEDKADDLERFHSRILAHLFYAPVSASFNDVAADHPFYQFPVVRCAGCVIGAAAW
jgi:hypothetical protein